MVLQNIQAFIISDLTKGNRSQFQITGHVITWPGLQHCGILHVHTRIHKTLLM